MKTSIIIKLFIINIIGALCNIHLMGSSYISPPGLREIHRAARSESASGHQLKTVAFGGFGSLPVLPLVRDQSRIAALALSGLTVSNFIFASRSAHPALPDFNYTMEHADFDYLVRLLADKPFGSTFILGQEPTISQVIFSLVAIDFEVAVYPVDGVWQITRGNQFSVIINKNWLSTAGKLPMLAHNHLNSFTLPSTQDLLSFNQGGIGLIVRGYGDTYEVTLFQTPDFNPATGRPFISKAAMKRFFLHEETIFYGEIDKLLARFNDMKVSTVEERRSGNNHGNGALINNRHNITPPVSFKALNQELRLLEIEYLRRLHIKMKVFHRVPSDEEALTISQFIERHRSSLKLTDPGFDVCATMPSTDRGLPILPSSARWVDDPNAKSVQHLIADMSSDSSL
ncbi:MAG: hypothetical protein ABII23_05315 [bacterium]